MLHLGASPPPSATHVCLPKVDPPLIWELIDSERVTHLNGAPTVLVMICSDDAARQLDAPGRGHDRGRAAARRR